MSFGANFLISDNSLSPNPWNTKIEVQSQSNIKCIYSHLFNDAFNSSHYITWYNRINCDMNGEGVGRSGDHNLR